MPVKLMRPFYGDKRILASVFCETHGLNNDTMPPGERHMGEEWLSTGFEDQLYFIPSHALVSVICSELDKNIPASVNKDDLLSRWKRTFNSTSIIADWDPTASGIIKGGTHSMRGPSQAKQRKDLVVRVVHTLKAVEELKTTEEIEADVALQEATKPVQPKVAKEPQAAKTHRGHGRVKKPRKAEGPRVMKRPGNAKGPGEVKVPTGP